MELDIHPDGDARPSHFTVLKEMLLFSAFRPIDGEELWVLEPGKLPRILKNISEGDKSSMPKDFVVWKDHVYFQADDGVHGGEIWRTDGTPEGTVMLRDIVEAPFEGVAFSSPRAIGGVLYFAADLDGRGTELCALDDTQTRIRLVRDIATADTFNVLAPAP